MQSILSMIIEKEWLREKDNQPTKELEKIICHK
jgi:hypothetical protein